MCQDLRLNGSCVVYWLPLMNTCISQKCSVVLSVLWHFMLRIWVGSEQMRQHCVEVRGQPRHQSLLPWAQVFAACLCSACRRLMELPAFGSLLCLPPSLCVSTDITGVFYYTQTQCCSRDSNSGAYTYTPSPLLPKRASQPLLSDVIYMKQTSL